MTSVVKSTEQKYPASSSSWAGVLLKITSAVELRKISRMTAQAEGAILPTE